MNSVSSFDFLSYRCLLYGIEKFQQLQKKENDLTRLVINANTNKYSNRLYKGNAYFKESIYILTTQIDAYML